MIGRPPKPTWTGRTSDEARSPLPPKRAFAYPRRVAHSEEPHTDDWFTIGADPGCCAQCVHAKLNVTRRGPAYLRCLRAGWDERLPRYPRLPVRECVGFEPHGVG